LYFGSAPASAAQLGSGVDDLMQRFNMIVESSALQLLTLVSMFAPYTTQTAGSK